MLFQVSSHSKLVTSCMGGYEGNNFLFNLSLSDDWDTKTRYLLAEANAPQLYPTFIAIVTLKQEVTSAIPDNSFSLTPSLFFYTDGSQLECGWISH